MGKKKRRLAIPCALLLLLLSTASVSAHAQLIKADPALGAVLDQAPAQVQLWFDEQVDPQFSEVRVLDPSRARLDDGQLPSASADRRSLLVAIKPSGKGTCTVVWKVFSATDGHITRGVYAFSVGPPADSVIASTEGDTGVSELTPFAAIIRAVGLLSLLALVGGSFFRLFLLDPSLRSVGADPKLVAARWRRLAAVALVLAFTTSAVELLLEANLIADELSVQSAAETVFDTRFGALWLIRVFLLMVMGVILFARSRRVWIALPSFSLGVVIALFVVANSLSLTRGLFLASLFAAQDLTLAQQIYLYVHHFGLFFPFVFFFGTAFYQKYDRIGILPIPGVLALLTRALGGHGAAVEGDLSLAMVADWLHLIAVSVWVGGLFNFAWLMPFVWRALDPAVRGKWIAGLTRQFSTAALGATLIIALTGLYSSLVEVPSLGEALSRFRLPTLDSMLNTLYGSTLTFKVALFGVMIAFGAVNLIIIGPRFRRAISAPEKRGQLFSAFRLTVSAEILTGISVVFLAGLLTIEPPARSQSVLYGSGGVGNASNTRPDLTGNASADTRVPYRSIQTDGELVFAPGDGTIWIQNAASFEANSLLKHSPNEFYESPAFSPDGSHIVFVTYRVSAGGGEIQEIRVMDLDGTNIRTLFTPPPSGPNVYLNYPRYAPDGESIYFSVVTAGATIRDQKYQIARGAAKGGDWQVVVGESQQPALSPDGKRLAFLRFNTQSFRSSLWVADAEGSNSLQLLADDVFAGILGERFSPDGKWIVFAASGPPSRKLPGSALRLDQHDGKFGSSRRQECAFELLARCFIQTAHADGLAWDLWLVSVDGKTFRQLTSLGLDSPWPAFSRDGRLVAFLSTTGLYVYDRENSRVSLLSNESAHGVMDWFQKR